MSPDIDHAFRDHGRRRDGGRSGGPRHSERVHVRGGQYVFQRVESPVTLGVVELCPIARNREGIQIVIVGPNVDDAVGDRGWEPAIAADRSSGCHHNRRPR